MKKLIILLIFLLPLLGCGSGGSNASNTNNVSESIIPYNAAAKCVDNSYSTSNSCSETCFGHGGVTQWMSYMITCGDGTQNPITINDIPTIEIFNVQPTVISVRSEMPYNQNVTFGISAFDGAGIKYIRCDVYGSDGTLLLGRGNSFSPTANNKIINKGFTTGISTELKDTFTLSCSVTDISANTATATYPITVQ